MQALSLCVVEGNVSWQHLEAVEEKPQVVHTDLLSLQPVVSASDI